jgi:hypothetical protein
LDARDADAFVARTLAKALPTLKEQIGLALALEQEDARDAANATLDPLAKSLARLPRPCRRYAPP